MRLLIVALMGARVATSCTVVEQSLQEAKKRSEVIFLGTITESRDREITFHVTRVWKGRVPATFVMPNVTWSSMQCMPGFYKGHLRPGVELLVFARRMPEFNQPGYMPDIGSRTAPVQSRAEDLVRLGPGHEPLR